MATNYNPNSVWGSKQKKYEYTPPSVPASPARKAEVEDEPPRKNHALLWSSIVFGVLLLGGLFYIFFLRAQAGPSVGIVFTKPDQILTGDPFDVSVTISNYSSSVLKDVTLSVQLPDNVSFSDQSPVDRALGDLGPESISPQVVHLIVTGDPNSVKHIDVKLTYGTDAAAKSRFETDGGADLLVGGPAITLNLNAPANIFSGQDFDTVVTYTNNTSHSFQNVQLTMQYPPVYSFTRSSMPASSGSRTWSLGTIPAAGSAAITVTGNIVGPDKAAYALEGQLTGSVNGNTYSLTDQVANLVVGSSPITLAVTLNNAADYIAKTSDPLLYTITYTNTSNVAFQNVSLKAAFVGDMYDFASLQSNGSFNSITNTVTWYPANTPQFLSLAPGQSGSVTVQVKTKPSFPIRLLSDKNYTLDVNAQIASPTVPPGTVASSTVSATTFESKVGGAATLAAKGFWRDAASGILNSGPYPPKVNQTTQYTIHWVITNYSTDLQNIAVSAYLQSGTTCTGQIKSNIGTAPTCDSGSGLVSWNIPSIPATTGISGAPAEAIIQVQNTPAVNQVGSTITLLGQSTLQATDAFTGNALKVTADPVTTDLPYDTTIPKNQVRQVSQ